MSELERKKIVVAEVCAIGNFARYNYADTIPVEEFVKKLLSSLEEAKKDEYCSDEFACIFEGDELEWRVCVAGYEVYLNGLIDEPEEEWKARVAQAEEKKRKQEEKERKQLQELMKKYPDIVKGEK